MEENTYGTKLLLLYSFTCVVSIIDTQEVTYRVIEEEPNLWIGNVAIDFNFSAYASDPKSLRFSLQSQDQPNVSYFNISENTGDLYTIGALDREGICSQKFTDCIIPVTAIVTSSKSSLFEKRSFNIFIEDINDNVPQFLVRFKSVSFLENSPIGTSLILDGAVDLDSSKYSVKSYIISPSNVPFKTNFSTNLDRSSSVHIIVSGELDREKIDNYQIQVIAVDGGMPSRSGTLSVNITITDINDNAPVFANAIYNISVNEDTAINSTILQVSANDLDKGENSKIIYGLAALQTEDISSLFLISSETGEIKTAGRLVYLPGHQYQVIVEASDCGSPSLTTQVLIYIQVQDSENNPPKIQVNLLSSSNYAKVTELANLGAVVAVIGVSDNDVGFNGVTNCSIASKSFMLQKSETSEYKVVVAETLEPESNCMLNVSVFCTDNGTPPLNASAYFQLFVVDENDHKPVFLQSSYTAEIKENNNVGYAVFKVSANDADFSKNAEISYELRGAFWTDFRLQPDGLVIAMKSFDRESQGNYEFSVLAIDHGDVPQTSTATVTVKIIDENDNKPQFTLAYYAFNVEENKPEKEFVGKLVAEDADIDNNGLVTYRLDKSGDTSVPFNVDPYGVLKTTMSLDRELYDRYDFTVIATDQGSPQRLSCSVNVTVFVLDMNDNSPFIVSPEKTGRIVYVSWSTPVNMPVYLIVAYDLDTGNNSKLMYKIEDRNDTHMFDINDSGQVLVAHPIEKQAANLYMIQVAVYDNGQPQNFAKTKLLMYITVLNSTAIANVRERFQNQNLVIALSVVIVTMVLAASIMITICVIRQLDKKKRNFFGADLNSEHSSDLDGDPGTSPAKQKDFYCQQTDNMPLKPILSQFLPSKTSTAKDYVYKPRMNTPTPSMQSEVSHKDIDLQLHEKQQSNDQNTPRLNRQTSLRLHQALVQSHDKQFTNHNDSVQSNDTYLQRPVTTEDSHSHVSEDGDSGHGGSVSDGHLGLSQDGDDLRILYLQNSKSGRHCTATHMKNRTTDDKYNLPISQKQCSLTPRENMNQSNQIQCSFTPRDNMNQSSQKQCSLTPQDNMNQSNQIQCSLTPRDNMNQSNQIQCSLTPRDNMNQSNQIQCSLTPRDNMNHSNQIQCSLTPRDNLKKSNSNGFIDQSISKNRSNQSISNNCGFDQSVSRTNKLQQSSTNINIEHSSDQYNSHTELKPDHLCSNTDTFGVDSQSERPPSVQQYLSTQDIYNYKNINSDSNSHKVKTSSGIQMGLSSFSNSHHSCHRNKPTRQHSFGSFENHRHVPTHLMESNQMAVYNNKILDETFESIATTVYEDDDNTTTSGSYTIDNNANDDFLELDVAQLNDMFV